MKTKTHIVYHKADFDGLFSGAICKYFMPEAECHGWDFGDPPIEIPHGDYAYVVDLPPDATTPCARVIWIDHHASSIAKWGTHVKGYRIDGVAASRLCWQWFTAHKDPQLKFPVKDDYLNRSVYEPLAVRLVGEYDVWDKRDPDAELFQYVLTAQVGNLSPEDKLFYLTQYFKMLDDELLHQIIALEGCPVDRYCKAFNGQNAKERTYRLKWEGLTFCVLNSVRGNSLSFIGADMEGVDALMLWRFDGYKTLVSLYHAPGQEHHDLSLIAAQYGGGGHKGACGFTLVGFPQMFKA